MPRVTITDVARAAGVSATTVSRAFSAPDRISGVTQHRVLDAARRLDYRPPRLRTAVVPARAPHPAPLLFTFFAAGPCDTLETNGFYSAILDGAQAEAERSRRQLLVRSTNRHEVTQAVAQLAAESARAAGGMLVGPAGPGVLAAFGRHLSNAVLIDNYDEMSLYESVISDGFGGMLAATRYLIDLGHRRIAFALAGRGSTSFLDRLRGYECALFESGIIPDPKWIVGRHAPAAEWEELIASSLGKPDGVTAILAANDQIARRVVRLCRERGRRVPEDVSVIGFDDGLDATVSDPELTTMRVDCRAMGRLGLRLLESAIVAQESGIAAAERTPMVKHTVPVSLIVRGSTAPLL